MNNVDFTNIIREEAVLFLLDLPKGEEVTILAQKKKDGKTLLEMERVNLKELEGLDQLFKANQGQDGSSPQS